MPASIRILPLLLFVLPGCLAAPRPSDEELLHAQAVSRPLLAAITPGCPISIECIASPQMSAYSYPDGRIILSTTLVRSLTEPELTAAIAHELGHLINDGHAHAALSGVNNSNDEESAADQTAAQLLRAIHQDPTTLQTMLAKVAPDPSLSADCKSRILRRVNQLRSPQ